MEDPDLSEQHHRDPTALALTDLSPKLNEKRLDITQGIVALTGCAKMASRVLRCVLLIGRMVLL